MEIHLPQNIHGGQGFAPPGPITPTPDSFVPRGDPPSVPSVPGDNGYVPPVNPNCYEKTVFYGHFTCLGEGFGPADPPPPPPPLPVTERSPGITPPPPANPPRALFKGTVYCQCYCSYNLPEDVTDDSLTFQGCSKEDPSLGRFVRHQKILDRGKCEDDDGNCDLSECTWRSRDQKIEFEVPLFESGAPDNQRICTCGPEFSSELAYSMLAARIEAEAFVACGLLKLYAEKDGRCGKKMRR